MTALSEAFEVIDAHPDLADFAGPQEDALINIAEQALGLELGADYRTFVSRYGAGFFGAHEIYGIFTSEFQASPPEAVGMTLDARERGLPPGMLIVYDGGDGSHLVLDHRGGETEPPIVRIELGAPEDAWEREYDGFADFLLDVTRRQVESE